MWVNGKKLSVDQKPDANGTLVTEREDNRQWQVRWSAPNRTETEITVPPGQVFVLGDNRSHSYDSQQFGTVPMRDVVGKARQVWFSWGKHGIRWNRLGQVIAP